MGRIGVLVSEMVQQLHDAKNWKVGMLDPEGIEELAVGFVGVREGLREAGRARWPDLRCQTYWADLGGRLADDALSTSPT